MRILQLLAVLRVSVQVICLTCVEILESPEARKISLQDLRIIPTHEMLQCLTHLTKEKLEKPEAEFIWQSIVKHYEGIPNVPDEVLMQLRWATPALTPEDYSNITLSSIDVIENFGLNYRLEDDQLSAIADRVRQDFASKEPEDYTFYDLTALRQILCAFNRSEIERIHPSSFKEAALVLGKLENCSDDVMLGFATLAIQKTAFGHPNNWTDGTVQVLGNVTKYLPKEFQNKLNEAN